MDPRPLLIRAYLCSNEEALLKVTVLTMDFGGDVTREPCALRLSAVLTVLADAHPFAAKVEAVEDLAEWCFSRGSVPGRREGEPLPTARLRLFLDVLDQRPDELHAVRAGVEEVLSGLDYVRLFTDTGLPSETGFVAECWERVLRGVLPEPPVERDAARLLHRLFADASSVRWFTHLDPELRRRLYAALLAPKAHDLVQTHASMRDAAVLLAVRIAGTGTADDVRERSPEVALVDSPFLGLSLLVRELAEGGRGPHGLTGAREATVEGMHACRDVLPRVLGSLDQTGISASLVYRLDYIRHLLNRLGALLPLLAPRNAHERAGAGEHLLLSLIRGGVADRSLAELARTNSRLIARRVIERAGRTGEHYVTRTRKELHRMVSSAAGGGALTAVAVLTKLLIAAAHLPLLTESLAIGMNYAGAFVLMQLCQFTLATKQPSMTAAALAHAIKVTEDQPDVSPLVEQVVCTVRSQLAALVGNLGMVVPAAVAIDLCWGRMYGGHLLGPEYADEVLAHHHPLTSGTILFAALTGVYLWLASVIGGMVENWFVVQRLPDAIRTNRRLRAALGAGPAARLSTWITDNVAGVGGNVGFAIILALVPMLAKMVGLSAEVRHITFVTGLLTFVGMERGPLGLLKPDFLWALSSIGVIGALNFLVSFTLALFVAFRARDVQMKARVGLLRGVLRRFRERPFDFVRAPREAG